MDIIDIFGDPGGFLRDLQYDLTAGRYRWIPLLVLVVIAVWFIWYFARTAHYRHVTGRSYDTDHGKYHRSYGEMLNYFRDAEPHKMDMSGFPVRSWQDTHGLIFGKYGKKLVVLPTDTEANIAVFGPPGSGKTAGIAIENAARFGGSVLAIDIKGDIYNWVTGHTSRKIIRFAPDAENALSISAHFDPLRFLRRSTDATEKMVFIENMANILVPDSGSSNEKYFIDTARSFFMGAVHLSIFVDRNISFPDIVHSILRSNFNFWIETAGQVECTEAREILSSMEGNNERNLAGAYNTLCTNLRHFTSPVLDVILSGSGSSISVADLDGGTDIYLQVRQENLEIFAPLFSLVIQSLAMGMMSRPDSSTGAHLRPVLFLLDEFPQLSLSLSMIGAYTATLRSKAVKIMMIQQNMAQLQVKFKDEGARSILGNCNVQIILGCNEANDADYFSRSFGMKKVLRNSTSISYSRSSSSSKSAVESEEPVFTAQDIRDLPSLRKAIFYNKGKYCLIDKINCYKSKDSAGKGGKKNGKRDSGDSLHADEGTGTFPERESTAQSAFGAGADGRGQKGNR